MNLGRGLLGVGALKLGGVAGLAGLGLLAGGGGGGCGCGCREERRFRQVCTCEPVTAFKAQTTMKPMTVMRPVTTFTPCTTFKPVVRCVEVERPKSCCCMVCKCCPCTCGR